MNRREPVGTALRIADVLGPYLGARAADDVARHLCARHGFVDEPIDPAVLSALQETIRKGLLSFVDPGLAHELARRCL
jgi:hypothetical protein